MIRIRCLLALLILTCASVNPGTNPAPAPRQLVFLMPQPVAWFVESTRDGLLSTRSRDSWMPGNRGRDNDSPVEFGSRVVLHAAPGIAIETLLDGGPLRLDRTLPGGTWILQGPDAWIAAQEAQRLAQIPGVITSYPVMRRKLRLHGPYAPRLNDPHYDKQWYLENRDSDGASLGLDLNVRAAWPVATGEDVTVAIADDGVEWSHPEFSRRAQHDLHFDFSNGTTNGLPVIEDDVHATAVAGLALAERDNALGMAGVAPDARVASWKIFRGSLLAPSDEQLMDMFQYRSNVVAVQNHSWGNSSRAPIAPTFLEQVGISNAVSLGRDGRGVVMVRSAGNGREQRSNVNDDGYASDPHVIAVTAVRRDGRVADYSNPGACVLVAAPGGAFDALLFTTDRRGTNGFNTGTYSDDFADYVFSFAIRGTSFAAPQIAGVAALLLSANSNLSVRDVQLILALASRHFDLADPDLRANGAGLLISHNIGFGVPDAGHAVELARRWPARPAATEILLSSASGTAIPDDGLRVVIDAGPDLPDELLSIPSTPGFGPHADVPTGLLPLVDVGLADGPILVDLIGKAALIQRDGNSFSERIEHAALAGAVLAIFYNNVGGQNRYPMAGTDFVPIPAVMINQIHGELLRDYLNEHPDTRAEIRLEAARYAFPVNQALICEHVGVRVRSTHARRGDVRITLLSPSGTRSVLQHLNQDNSPGPDDWTYYSVQHFLEPTVGTWQIEVSDEQPENTGTVSAVDLILRGVEIMDADRDGLDDQWELEKLGTLAFGLRDDPDGDGYNNAIEQILGTNPLAPDVEFKLDLSPWDDEWVRLSWPGRSGQSYELLTSIEATHPLNQLADIPGRFPVTEWFIRQAGDDRQFFRLRIATPAGTTSTAPTP
jgi:subtilisin family serine protease/subtilisin-like proprotein convertase family protein